MRTDKKSSLKADKKSGLGGRKPSAVGYGKQTALLEEAITQMNAGRYGRTSAVLKDLLAMDPHNMEARRLFATLHLRVGSLILARQAFDSLIDEAFGRQDYWLAESLLREYLAAGPRCVPYLEKLGSIHQDKGEMLEAVAEYGKAVEILLEDPDSDQPDRPSQLYAKIKEIAPGSSVAVRLAGYFDAQTGELIARPLAEAAAHVSSSDESGAGPMVSEPIAESMPWEQEGTASANRETAGSSYSEGAPGNVHTDLQQESDGLGHAPSYESPMNGHGAIDLNPESPPSWPGDPTPLGTEQLRMPGEASQDIQQADAAQEVPPPMPWEDVQEATVGIPDQTVTESSDAMTAATEPDQAPAGSAPDVSNESEFSWDSVFQNVLKVGNEPSVPTIQPLYAQEVDPGTIEIPEAAHASLSVGTPWIDPAAAPMPWDQVQESPIGIPQDQPGETAAECSVEPAPEFHPEPVPTQDRPFSILSTAEDASGPDTFSIMGSSSGPFLSEPDDAPVDSPLSVTAMGYQDNGEASAQEASTFSFAGEPLNPMETAASEPPWTSADGLSPADEPASVESISEGISFSSEGDAADSAPAPQADVVESLEEPRAKLNSSTSWALLDERSDRRAEQEEEQQPTLMEANAPPEPAPSPKEWVKTEKALRFVEESSISPAVEETPQAPRWGDQGAIHQTPPAADAGDVLFESAGPLTQIGTTGRATRPTKPRPTLGARLSRLRIAISSFIGSCFSTTRAIVMSIIGLVLLSCVMAALGVGAVGVVWIIMEEPPSSTFRSLTTSPPRTVSDMNKNGYLFLLGFEASSGQHPIQVGYEQKVDGNDSEKALACLRGDGDGSDAGHSNASGKVLSGWFKGPDPVGRFMSNRGTIDAWAQQGEATLRRYGQWHKFSFDDWGYGAPVSPPCDAINFAHRLYLAEGFTQGGNIGMDRLEADMEAWRMVLSQAKTLPMKSLAVHAINDDIAVASGLLAQPGFEGQYLGRLAKMLRPLDQAELSIRWPMQSELVAASKTFESQLKVRKGEEQAVHAAIASALPLPKQRRLNDYADYYDASDKAAGEGRHGALPKWSTYIQYPAKRMTDYFTNPIENIVGLEPLVSWDLYHGLVVDTEARLRLASLQAWIRRGSQDADLLSRIAKAGQNFYDPYTGFPMLVNLKKRALYSVGHDGKDQDADPQFDVVVAIPAK